MKHPGGITKNTHTHKYTHTHFVVLLICFDTTIWLISQKHSVIAQSTIFETISRWHFSLGLYSICSLTARTYSARLQTIKLIKWQSKIDARKHNQRKNDSGSCCLFYSLSSCFFLSLNPIAFTVYLVCIAWVNMIKTVKRSHSFSISRTIRRLNRASIVIKAKNKKVKSRFKSNKIKLWKRTLFYGYDDDLVKKCCSLFVRNESGRGHERMIQSVSFGFLM